MISNQAFVLIAQQMAKDSQCRKKHCAIIAKGQKVLSVAVNIQKTHPAGYFLGQRSYHAEARAILRAGVNLRGATLYSLRDKDAVSSRPCSHCLDMIMKSGIRNIVYTIAGNKGIMVETL